MKNGNKYFKQFMKKFLLSVKGTSVKIVDTDPDFHDNYCKTYCTDTLRIHHHSPVVVSKKIDNYSVCQCILKRLYILI